MNLVCYLGILSKMSSKRQRKCSPEAGNKGKKTKVVKNVDQVYLESLCDIIFFIIYNK